MCQSLDGLLGNTVLQGMKRDDAQPSSGAEHIGGVTQSSLEDIQLVVDRDPEPLECPCRAVDSSMAIGRRHRPFDVVVSTRASPCVERPASRTVTAP